MSIPDYSKNISQRLNSDSDEIRKFFSTHRPSAGANREGLVANFLNSHLPSRYEVTNGLIYFSGGEFSKQADVVICDRLNNAPLFRDQPEPIWLVEAVYSLIEVKTTLAPSEIDDCLAKCKRFKSLERNFSDRTLERISDSLFLVWAFEGPSPERFRDTIVEKLEGLCTDQLPDLIIVPGMYVCMSGQYREIVRLGQPGSTHRNYRDQCPDLKVSNKGRGFEIAVLNEHSLLAGMVWLSSWQHQAGERHSSLVSYLPKILESGNDYQLFT